MNVRRHSRCVLISALRVYLLCKNVKAALSVGIPNARPPHMVNVGTAAATSICKLRGGSCFRRLVPHIAPADEICRLIRRMSANRGRPEVIRRPSRPKGNPGLFAKAGGGEPVASL